MGERNGVSIVLGTVGTNLKDCAPFASTHRTNLGAEALGQWEANYRLGEEALAAGKFTEALAAFGKAATLDDSFADLQFRMGQCHTALGQREEALNHFTLARDLDALRFRCDSSLNTIIRRVATQNSARKFSFFDCDQVLREQSPDGLPGQEFFYEHVHLTFKGNYLLAKGFAEKVAKALPEEVTKAGGADWASLDDCAQSLGWTDWSRQQGLSLIASRLNDPPFTAQLNHADQLKRLGQEMEQLAAAKASGGLKQSLESCREAAAADPQDWVIQSVLARIQTAQGDFSGAADSLRKVRELMPHYVEGLQELGGLLANEHQDQDAELAFKDALKLEPSSVVAHTGLGQLYERQEKFELAIVQFKAALRTKPYWSPAHLGLGKCLEKTGKSEEAQPHLRAALKNRVNTAASFRALAKFCFEKGWSNEAVTNFSDVLRFEPGDANTRVNLGLAFEKLGRHEEAIAQYMDAVSLSPNLAEAHARLAWELGRNGDDSQALQHFAEAVRLKPDLIEARLNLGIALLKQGRRDEADLQFREVLRRNPGNAVAVRYLQSLGSMPK